jgi:hypothetical protein
VSQHDEREGWRDGLAPQENEERHGTCTRAVPVSSPSTWSIATVSSAASGVAQLRFRGSRSLRRGHQLDFFGPRGSFKVGPAGSETPRRHEERDADVVRSSTALLGCEARVLVQAVSFKPQRAVMLQVC